MMHRMHVRLSWAFIAALAAFVTACGGSSQTGAAVSTATPVAIPTNAPTATRTPATLVAEVNALVVVNRTVGSGTADELGAPPAEWAARPEGLSFDRALANADWSVDGVPGKQGLTTSDGELQITDLAPGNYTLQVTKTIGGNLLPVTIAFAVGDHGMTDVVAEVAWGLVRTTSTYTLDGAQVREVHGPYGTVLVERNGQVSELGDPSRILIDRDGDGHFDPASCLDHVPSCDADSACPADHVCQCVAACALCDSCTLPGVCVPKGTPPPYRCTADGGCAQSGDRCVPASPVCHDAAACAASGLSVCLPSCALVELESITITSGPSQLVVGRQGQLYAIARLSDGTQIDVTYLATWTSSDAQVASVDSWGTVSGLVVGATDVTASVGGLTSAPWSVEVVARPALQRINIQNVSCFCGPIALGGPQVGAALPPCVFEAAPSSDILPVPRCGQVLQVGGTIQFSALGEFSDGSYEDITKEVQWRAVPAAVGDLIDGLFTGRQAGTATATAALDGVVSDATEVRVVTQPTVVALSIYADNAVATLANDAPVPGGVAVPCTADAPDAAQCCCPGPLRDDSTPCGCGYSITILSGDHLQFHATAQYDTGEWREVTDQVAWRSTDAPVAAIDSAGLLVAAQAGDATIGASLGDVTSNPVGVRVVNQATLQSLYIYEDGSYQNRVLAKGDQRFYKAMASYDVGFARDVTAAATWRSSDESVGGFSQPGIFTGRAAGTVQVWAELNDQPSNFLSLEVYETSELNYCDVNAINRAVWSDAYNRVVLESDCAAYRQPGVATLRYTITETQPHGGVFDPCLDLYVYDGKTRVRTIREEGCGAPFLPTSAPGSDQEALKYQLRAFWDLKGDDGQPVAPGLYTIYGRFYLYYDPVVSLTVKVLSPDGTLPTPIPTPTPGSMAALVVGSAVAFAGERVSVDVSLKTAGKLIVATQNDLLFDPAVAVAADAHGRPACTVNADINKGATAFAFVPPGCRPGVDCKGIRALVLAVDNSDPIPDDILYTCQVAVAAYASGTYPLIAATVIASDPSGAALSIRSINGQITTGAMPGVVCTPPACKSGEVFSCPGECPGGCGTICATPTPTPSTQGVCFKGSSVCESGGVGTTQSACCTLARLSLSPLAFSWCPADRLDAAGKCDGCFSNPCDGLLPPTPSAF